MSDTNINQIKDWLRKVIELSKSEKEVHKLLSEVVEIASKPFHHDNSKEIVTKQESEVEINPISIFTEGGEDGLIKALKPLSSTQLINIIKKYGFDPSRKSHRWRKKERLIDLIVQRIKSSTSRGDVFLK